MAKDKTPPDKKTVKKSGEKTTAKKAAAKKTTAEKASIKEPKVSTKSKATPASEKPLEISIDNTFVEFDASTPPGQLSHDAPMDINWQEFSAVSEFKAKPEETYQEEENADFITIPSVEAIEGVVPVSDIPQKASDETWEDLLSQAFGPEPTALEKISEENIHHKHSNAQTLNTPKTPAATASSVSNNPMDDWLGSLMGESTVSSSESITPLTSSIPQPESNTFVSASESKSVSYLDNLLESVFEETATPIITEELPVTTKEKNEEAITEPVQPYLVADHQTVFIDENTPENSVNFETQLDTIAFALNDEINEDLLGHQQFSFKHDDALAPHDLIITRSEQFENNNITQKIPSITLDAGIIISDEPLPISEIQDEPTVKLADLILNENEDDDAAIILPDMPITLGLTGQQNQVTTYESTDNTVALSMTSNPDIESIITDNTGCTHFYANDVIAGDNLFTTPTPAKYEISEPQEVFISSLKEPVSYALEETETTLESIEPVVPHVETPKASTTESALQMTSVQTNIRFIPVKNTHQDWVFSVIDFGSPIKHTAFEPTAHVPYAQPLSDFNFDIQPAQEAEAYVTPVSPPIPEASPEIKIQLDTTYDDLDFDFSSLFAQDEDEKEVSNDSPIATPIENKPFSPSLPDISIRSKQAVGNTAFISYPIGCLVDHPHYGRGVVQKIIQAPHQNAILHVEFEKHGKRLLDPSLTPLKQLNAPTRSSL